MTTRDLHENTSIFFLLATIDYCTAAKYTNKYGRDPTTKTKKSIHSSLFMIAFINRLNKEGKIIPKGTNDAEINKRHKCNVCCKAFKFASYLRKHERTHTGEKPYKCNVCTRAFTLSHHLKTHERTHTGEKPYECNVCHKTFRDKSNLRKHKRTHTGEKPYECDVCHKMFNDSSNRRTHIKKQCNLATAIKEGL